MSVQNPLDKHCQPKVGDRRRTTLFGGMGPAPPLPGGEPVFTPSPHDPVRNSTRVAGHSHLASELKQPPRFPGNDTSNSCSLDTLLCLHETQRTANSSNYAARAPAYSLRQREPARAPLQQLIGHFENTLTFQFNVRVLEVLSAPQTLIISAWSH